ncbi:MAG: efflux RND transporter periplasmic adaptor subunit [Luteitalea sp.]|nr:efflux RND transporter periplasmic adaptor subunit [Luteitalea sp.]
MKLKLVAAVVVAVVVASSVVYYRAGATSTEPRLLTATVTRGPVVETVEATGTVEPVDTVEVGSQVTGTLKTLAADFNDIVKRGQVIATLDPASLEAQLQQAEASVRRLEAEVESARVQVKDAEQKQARAEALARDQLLAASDLDSARITTEVSRAALKSVEAQLVQARASLEQSRVNLGHTIITAPVDGIVLSRDVEVGQTVTASLETPTLFVIARDLGTMQVNASVDEADIGRVQVGQPVRFHVDAYGDDEFGGTVSQVHLQPIVEQNVVSYTTEIKVPNTGLKLKPGMTATVSIEVARDDDALRVPTAALRFNPSAEVLAAFGKQKSPSAQSSAASNAIVQPASLSRSSGERQEDEERSSTTASSRAAVWRLDDGGVERVPVELGVGDGTSSAIVGGRLEEGAEVVVGQPSVAAGAATGGSSGSPLLPSFPRRGGRGAPRGG